MHIWVTRPQWVNSRKYIFHDVTSIWFTELRATGKITSSCFINISQSTKLCLKRCGELHITVVELLVSFQVVALLCTKISRQTIAWYLTFHHILIRVSSLGPSRFMCNFAGQVSASWIGHWGQSGGYITFYFQRRYHITFICLKWLGNGGYSLFITHLCSFGMSLSVRGTAIFIWCCCIHFVIIIVWIPVLQPQKNIYEIDSSGKPF